MARGAHRAKFAERLAHAAATRTARAALQMNGATRLYAGGGVLARSAAARHARAAMPIGERLKGLDLSAGLMLPSSSVMASSASNPAPTQPNMAMPAQPQDQSQSGSRIVRPAPQTMTQGQRDYFAYVDRVAAEARANANARAQEALQAQLAQRDQGSGLPANIAMSDTPLRHGYTPTAYGDDYEPQGNAPNWDPTLKPVKADFTYHSQESGGVGTVYPNRPSDETPSSTVTLATGDAVANNPSGANTGGGGGGSTTSDDDDNNDAAEQRRIAAELARESARQDLKKEAVEGVVARNMESWGETRAVAGGAAKGGGALGYLALVPAIRYTARTYFPNTAVGRFLSGPDETEQPTDSTDIVASDPDDSTQ